MSRVALVAGAGGIIGKALLEEIARTPDWRGLALGQKRRRRISRNVPRRTCARQFHSNPRLT